MKKDFWYYIQNYYIPRLCETYTKMLPEEHYSVFIYIDDEFQNEDTVARFIPSTEEDDKFYGNICISMNRLKQLKYKDSIYFIDNNSSYIQNIAQIVIHECRHAQQHYALYSKLKDLDLIASLYRIENDDNGYIDNIFEVDAIAYSLYYVYGEDTKMPIEKFAKIVIGTHKDYINSYKENKEQINEINR